MKRILIIWIAMLLLFAFLLYLFIKSEHTRELELKMTTINDCISLRKSSQFVWYSNNNIGSYGPRGERNEDNTEWHFINAKGEEQKLTYNTDYDYYILYQKVAYDDHYHNNSIDILEWEKAFVNFLSSNGIYQKPIAIQISDTLGNVLYNSNPSFSPLKNVNRYISTDPLVLGVVYPHKLIAYFEKEPFYKGLEYALFLSIVFMIISVWVVFEIIKMMNRDLLFAQYKQRNVSYINREYSAYFPFIMDKLNSIREVEDKKGQYIIRLIKAQLSKMQEVLKSMANDFSSKKIVLSDFSIPISNILNNVVDCYTTIYSNVNCKIHIEKGCENILFEDFYFQAMINNLVDNAIKYNDSILINLNISFSAREKELELIIEDNGIGMDDREIKYIFVPYYRVKNKLTKYRSGMGLGLAFVKKVVDAYRGDITVKSELGKGTSFIIRIPV